MVLVLTTWGALAVMAGFQLYRGDWLTAVACLFGATVIYQLDQIIKELMDARQMAQKTVRH